MGWECCACARITGYHVVREQGGHVPSDMFTSMTMNSIHALSDQAAQTLSGGYDCKPMTYPCTEKVYIPKIEIPKIYLPSFCLPMLDIKWGCSYPAPHAAMSC